MRTRSGREGEQEAELVRHAGAADAGLDFQFYHFSEVGFVARGDNWANCIDADLCGEVAFAYAKRT